MINLDTRLLDKTSPDGLYLLCRITAYMNANRFCFPSNKSLAKATGFSESKVNRVKKELIEQNLISCAFRFRKDKSQTSSIYKIKTGLISVFVRGDEMSELTPSIVTDDTPPIFTDDTPPYSLVTTREVLEDLSIVHLEVLKGNVETSSTPFLDDEEMESLEEKISASKLNQNPTPQVATLPRPKAKKEKVVDPAPIRAMFDLYADKYAELNNGVKPEFMVKYTPSMKNLYGILHSRSITTGFVPLDDLEPWRDFLTAWTDYLQKNEKEKWHRDNFNPLTFFSQFNSIIAKLNNRPKTEAEKWVEWGKRQGL
jgi:hypothetical protein